LTHTFLVLVTVGLGHGAYRKLHALTEVQRAEKFENHCSRPCVPLPQWSIFTFYIQQIK